MTGTCQGFGGEDEAAWLPQTQQLAQREKWMIVAFATGGGASACGGRGLVQGELEECWRERVLTETTPMQKQVARE